MPDQRCHAIAGFRASRRGFGLIELMITIAMIAVLTAIALPSYSYLIRNNRISTQANDFLSAANYARNEAITRSRSVTLCAADTTGAALPVACGAAADWVKGWMVFLDESSTGPTPTAIDAANILRTWIASPHNTFSPDADQTYVRFSPRGESGSNPVGDLTFTLLPVSSCSNRQMRQIVITSLGRSGSTKMDCP